MVLLIGGPSAGAAIAVATVAAIEGKNVSKDAVITGTIEEGGYIGEVGGVFEKPKIFWFTFVSVWFTSVGLKEYKKGKMEVEEVSTIDDAVAYRIR